MKWKLTLLFVVIASLVCIGYCESRFSSQKNHFASRRLLELNGNGRFLHGITHKAVSGTEVNTSLFIATLAGYGSALLNIAVFFIVMSVFSVILAIVACVSFAFTSMKRKEEKEADEVAKWIFPLRLIFIGISVGLIILAIIAVVGHNSYLPSFDTMATTISDGTESEANRATAVEDRCLNLDYNTTLILLESVSLKNNSEDIREKGKLSANYLRNNHVYLGVLLGFTMAFIFLTAIVGIATGIFPRKFLAITLGILAFFPMVLCWVSMGLYFPLSVFTADMCYDISEYTIHQRLLDRQAIRNSSNPNYGGIDDVMRVIKTGPYGGFTNLIAYLKQGYEEELNVTSPGEGYDELVEKLAEADSIQAELDSLVFGEYLDTYLTPHADAVCGYVNGPVSVWASLFLIAVFLVPLAIIAFWAAPKFSAWANKYV